MACNTILSGIINDCPNVYGGIVQIGIVAKEHVTGTTISNGLITDIQSSEDFSDYYFAEGHATAAQGSEFNFENSTTIFNNSITLSLKGQNLIKRNELLLLAKAQQELAVVYKLDTGVCFALGLSGGMQGSKIGARVSEITGTVGARRADENQFDLTITVEQDKELPLVVDETLFPTLF